MDSMLTMYLSEISQKLDTLIQLLEEQNQRQEDSNSF